jgi:cation transport ATPase
MAMEQAAFQLAVSLLLTIPLVAHWVAMAFGWNIFFLADPRIQTVWATLLQTAAAWPFYSRSLGRGAGTERGFCRTVALLTTGLYAYGLFLTFARPDVRSHPYYQLQACVITGATLLWLLSGLARRRRS